MLVNDDFSLGKARTINNAGMIVFVTKDNAFAITQGGNDTHIGHVASVKEERSLRSLKAS